MKFAASLSLLASIAFGAPLATEGPAYAPLVLHENALEGDYMIAFKSGHTLDAHESFLGHSLREALHIHWHEEDVGAPCGYAARLDDDTLARVRADPMIDYVEQDFQITILQPESYVDANVSSRIDSRLEDSNHVLKRYPTAQRNAPWNLAIASAQSVIKGNQPGTFDYDTSSSGAGVDIYIVDSGVNVNHNDFGGRATAFFDATETVTADQAQAGDTYGHGTGVADIAGGTNYGAAKGANILSVKVVTGPSNSGPARNLMNGIRTIIRRHKRRVQDGDFRGSVINYSVDFAKAFKEIDESDPVQAQIPSQTADAIRAANDLSIIQVAAAGNSNDEAKKHIPAGYAGMITVATMTDQYQLGRSSSYGTDVDIIAPGTGVTCAAANSNDGYITVTGTSYAAPLVAGVCAQFLSYLGPKTSRNELFQMLIAFSVENVVDLTAGKEQTPNRVVNNGFNTKNWPGRDDLKH